MEKSKKNKIICPTCKGNGYIRVPYRLAKEEVTAQCGVCDSQGEVDADSVDNIIIFSYIGHVIYSFLCLSYGLYPTNYNRCQ